MARRFKPPSLSSTSKFPIPIPIPIPILLNPFFHSHIHHSRPLTLVILNHVCPQPICPCSSVLKSSTFPNPLQIDACAADLFDDSVICRKLVEKVESENGRPLFLVAGSQAHPYVCFTDYCPCYYFTQKVIVSSEALACKHTLAVRIADALGSLHASKVTKEQFSEYLVLQGSSPATYKSPSKGFYSSR